MAGKKKRQVKKTSRIITEANFKKIAKTITFEADYQKGDEVEKVKDVRIRMKNDAYDSTIERLESDTKSILQDICGKDNKITKKMMEDYIAANKIAISKTFA